MREPSRRAARLIVLDEDGAVLLFQYEDDRGHWWGTPGGGLEANESFSAAARREAQEELALQLDGELGAPLWESTVEFTSRGRLFHQLEQFFLVRRPRAALALGENLGAAHRQEGIVATRWWSPAELRAATEAIFPEDLGARLEALARPD